MVPFFFFLPPQILLLLELASVLFAFFRCEFG